LLKMVVESNVMKRCGRGTKRLSGGWVLSNIPGKGQTEAEMGGLVGLVARSGLGVAAEEARTVKLS
jgi:hypothetical protein